MREQLELFDKFRELYHFTVKVSLKPQRFNTYAISQYNNIKNVKRYLFSYHNINKNCFMVQP